MDRYKTDPTFRKKVLDGMKKYNAKPCTKERKKSYNREYFQNNMRCLKGGLQVSIGNVSF